jgi:hypothetical protein
MSAVSESAAELLLTVMFGRVANPFPATYYIALSSTQPDSTGGNVTEPSDPSYARAAYANTIGNWVVGGPREVENDGEIQFTQATAPWGDCDYFAIYSAATAGTFYGWGNLGATVSPVSGEVVRFLVGDLIISSPAGV